MNLMYIIRQYWYFAMNKDDMDSAMFEEVAKLFNTNSDVKNGSSGIKTEFYHDFIKHVCSGSMVEYNFITNL